MSQLWACEGVKAEAILTNANRASLQNDNMRVLSLSDRHDQEDYEDCIIEWLWASARSCVSLALPSFRTHLAYPDLFDPRSRCLRRPYERKNVPIHLCQSRLPSIKDQLLVRIGKGVLTDCNMAWI